MSTVQKEIDPRRIAKRSLQIPNKQILNTPISNLNKANFTSD
jgi:hypothetical protein